MTVLATFKKYQYLLRQLIVKEIKLKYRNSYLGVLWTLLEPLLTMMVLSAVFSSLLGKGTENFPVYILTGRLLFSFFSSSTTLALKSVRNHAGMIKKVYVPKYMYPLASVISNYIIFLISLLVLAIVASVEGVKPTLYLFQAIIPLVTILGLALGTGLILSTLAVFFRDLEYLWGIVTMIIMYTSAIFYKADHVITDKNKWIFKANPIFACIENFRAAVFGRWIDLNYAIYSAAAAGVLVIVGLIVFYKNQDKFVLHL